MRVLDRVQTAPLTFASSVTTRQLLLVGLLAVVVFTRFWRLGTPGEFYFDEVYFPVTGQEILRGDPEAWEFFGHENTHPPLSKLFMAGGMGIFGETSEFGARFFGALAGVGSIIFIYLLARRLFRNDLIAMLAAFLMTFEGLAFTQSRMATPDAYVLFFVLGAVYFAVTERFLLSGVFLGAALASKWVAFFTIVPIVLYLLYRYWRVERGRGSKIPYLAPVCLLAFFLGTPALFGEFIGDPPGLSPPLFSAAIGVWMAFWALAPIGVYIAYRTLRPRENSEEQAAAAMLAGIPLFFVAVPLYIYIMTYLPMLLNEHSLSDVFILNKSAYVFHSTLDATHPYQAPWNTWPILKRPVFLYLGPEDQKIYNLGNPLIFWFGLPALGFALWQGLGGVRAKIDAVTGQLSVWGRLRPGDAGVVFVVLSFLALWLPWAIQPRIMFLYHYLPASAFLTLALAYALYRLWDYQHALDFLVGLVLMGAGVALNRLDAMAGLPGAIEYIYLGAILVGGLALIRGLLRLVRPDLFPAPTSDVHWGRIAAGLFLVGVAVTFIYFYPHLAAVEISHRMDESYYWFASWR